MVNLLSTLGLQKSLMDPKSFDNQMRELEYFHSLRLLPSAWAIIRVDGRSFSRFTESRFEKPFDIKFHELMVTTAQILLSELDGIYAFMESDEISVLLPRDWDLFDRSLEKAVSISAGIASSQFSCAIGEPAVFDSRVWLGATNSQVFDYFSWRQADTTRCALNGWCYWTLRKAGHSARQATSMLDGKSVSFKNELLFENGINFNDLPLWQRRGTGLYWETYEKVGYNPKEKIEVTTTRRRIKIDRELLMKEEYRSFIQQILEPSQVLLPSSDT
jgi:tRNA(His) guanylyltransferase